LGGGTQHNGSVPTLAELLKPADQRVKALKVGPAYDTGNVGLAAEQTRFNYTGHLACRRCRSVGISVGYRAVELHIVERASDNTIGRTLKKTFSNRIASSNG
jgi:hypothetical protein